MRGLVANLKLWQKFALIGALALGMLAIPTTLVVSLHMDSVRTALAEAGGIGPAGEALKLLQLTQQHRGLSAASVAGDKHQEPARQAAQGKVDEALSRTTQSVTVNLDDTALSAELQKIKREWQALATAVNGGAVDGPQSFARHTALIQQQMTLLESIVESSGLAFTSDPASHHMVSAVFGSLPELTEILGQARALGLAVLVKGEAAPVQLSRIDVLHSAARRAFQNTYGSFDKAANDPDLKQLIASPVAAARKAAESGLAMPNEKILQAVRLDFPAQDYWAGMSSAIDAQFDVIGVAFAVLEARIAMRVSEKQQALWSMVAAIAVLGVVAFLISLMVVRMTVGSIGRSLHIAQTVAGGDLTSIIDVSSTDETGQLLLALSRMNNSLTGIVTKVRSGTDSIATASSQIAAGNIDLSARTEAQASSLEETAASMEELTSTVSQNAGNAQMANELALSASAVAVRGGAVVRQVVETMASIHVSSRRIVDIIGIIDGIAFQTNILALNAAVEAARAGEQGRGFAVVASEVRSLAQRSAAAAKEIKDLIDESVNQMGTGSELASVAGQTMDEVVDSIKRVTDIMGEITVASQEQTCGIEQINQAVAQMDQVTQQNAALVQEAAAATLALQDQADELVTAVSIFRTPAMFGHGVVPALSRAVYV
ncbi:methyl-accepting chemotaxis protein [Pollutimonas nitritireducens]|nr:methyl-accepting chemotaxis protein [Pollutimonas nitritireducens]